MNAFFKAFVAASLLAVASAGPVQNAKRQASTPTTAAPNTSFTPFTGTFASAFPAVTIIDQWMAAHPSDRTRSFTVATETATPTCNVLKCPIPYSNGVPIYGGTSSLPVFPSPTNSL